MGDKDSLLFQRFYFHSYFFFLKMSSFFSDIIFQWGFNFRRNKSLVPVLGNNIFIGGQTVSCNLDSTTESCFRIRKREKKGGEVGEVKNNNNKENNIKGKEKVDNISTITTTEPKSTTTTTTITSTPSEENIVNKISSQTN